MKFFGILLGVVRTQHELEDVSGVIQEAFAELYNELEGFFFFQAVDDIRVLVRSRGRGVVYTRQVHTHGRSGHAGRRNPCSSWLTSAQDVCLSNRPCAA